MEYRRTLSTIQKHSLDYNLARAASCFHVFVCSRSSSSCRQLIVIDRRWSHSPSPLWVCFVLLQASELRTSSMNIKMRGNVSLCKTAWLFSFWPLSSCFEFHTRHGFSAAATPLFNIFSPTLSKITQLPSTRTQPISSPNKCWCTEYITHCYTAIDILLSLNTI